MDAEQIVRALAAQNPIGGDCGWDYCTLCSVGGEAAHHDPDCPWRLAVEWVAAEDGQHQRLCPNCDHWTAASKWHERGAVAYDDRGNPSDVVIAARCPWCNWQFDAAQLDERQYSHTDVVTLTLPPEEAQWLGDAAQRGIGVWGVHPDDAVPAVAALRRLRAVTPPRPDETGEKG